MILNNPRTFRSRGFTVVPHDRFRGEGDKLQAITEIQTLFDSRVGKRTAGTRANNPTPLNEGRLAVEQILNRFLLLTFYQSEDPV